MTDSERIVDRLNWIIVIIVSLVLGALTAL
jgi:hypothetical protein